ncbi:RagB/SusD family nutrient uptake outer membrane protein [Pedobacter sp. MC2016-24]|uniref:RagB/SusD family nutrient uptake outer membrane protein n=1 Tax=Pedobacter sp. MC2016-24 TaxID=2780090 RepID=UPI0018800D5A|nr:RagB/SusD family nutrient uptake outer membrane protein [Pedobacter sp. MC2016-24]MBE9600797.1 RagB/SusD family nutrient uptake outer membrane protein [Pedobacter sp. MC2016-24]
MKTFIISILTCGLMMTATSCKKFLDLKPLDSYTEDTFYNDEKGLQGGLISCYDALQTDSLYGNNLLTLAELRGDNLIDNDPGSGAGVRNQIEVFSETSANSILTGTWLGSYRAIYRCNIILDRAPAISMNETTKNQIIGQAKFIRALNYFNLTRLWGNVPLVLKVQKTEEARQNSRATAAQIYQQVIDDLTDAAVKLPTSWPDVQRGRATSYAAAGLLGKVYLYQKRFDLVASTLQPVVAAIYAGTILATVPQSTTFPNNLKTSKDVIFAVQYLAGGVKEFVHQDNRYRNNNNTNIISIPQSLFEATDNRKALVAITGTGGRPGKFNAPQANNETSSDFPVVRCADVLLMYAEALNETAYGNTEAFKALNAVRSNAGASIKTQTTLTSQIEFRTAVYLERRLELALEADRWFDIVRTNQMGTIFPGIPTFRSIYPVPQVEIDNINDKSGWQNTGYN